MFNYTYCLFIHSIIALSVVYAQSTELGDKAQKELGFEQLALRDLSELNFDTVKQEAGANVICTCKLNSSGAFFVEELSEDVCSGNFENITDIDSKYLSKKISYQYSFKASERQVPRDVYYERAGSGLAIVGVPKSVLITSGPIHEILKVYALPQWADANDDPAGVSKSIRESLDTAGDLKSENIFIFSKAVLKFSEKDLAQCISILDQPDWKSEFALYSYFKRNPQAALDLSKSILSNNSLSTSRIVALSIAIDAVWTLEGKSLPEDVYREVIKLRSNLSGRLSKVSNKDLKIDSLCQLLAT